MLSEADQVEMLGLLAAHEAALGDLYRAYGGRFPEHAALFETLVTGERDHARWITDFANQVRAGDVRVRSGRFSSQAVLASLDRVQECLRQAPVLGLTLLAALSAGLDLEEGMIEKRFFEIVEGDGEELQGLLSRLESETTAHRAQLRAAWEQECGG